MSDAVELRRKAALYRRIARIPTSGGGSADRVLLQLADRLDDEAATAEPPFEANSAETKRRRMRRSGRSITQLNLPRRSAYRPECDKI
jgi:hypothetical protein